MLSSTVQVILYVREVRLPFLMETKSDAGWKCGRKAVKGTSSFVSRLRIGSDASTEMGFKWAGNVSGSNGRLTTRSCSYQACN